MMSITMGIGRVRCGASAVMVNLEGRLERIEEAERYVTACGGYTENLVTAILATRLCGIELSRSLFDLGQ
jgi:hypothetical protein